MLPPSLEISPATTAAMILGHQSAKIIDHEAVQRLTSQKQVKTKEKQYALMLLRPAETKKCSENNGITLENRHFPSGYTSETKWEHHIFHRMKLNRWVHKRDCNIHACCKVCHQDCCILQMLEESCSSKAMILLAQFYWLTDSIEQARMLVERVVHSPENHQNAQALLGWLMISQKDDEYGLGVEDEIDDAISLFDAILEAGPAVEVT